MQYRNTVLAGQLQLAFKSPAVFEELLDLLIVWLHVEFLTAKRPVFEI